MVHSAIRPLPFASQPPAAAEVTAAVRRAPDVPVSLDPRVKVEFCTRASDGAGFLGTGFLGTGFRGTGFRGTGFLGSLTLPLSDGTELVLNLWEDEASARVGLSALATAVAVHLKPLMAAPSELLGAGLLTGLDTIRWPGRT